MTVLDLYFELSDVVGQDQSSFEKLISLFSDKAILRPAGGVEVMGKEAIGEFFEKFFKRNVVLHHVWATQAVGKKLESSWAVAGKRKDGTVFALEGVDKAELDEHEKILTLEVQVTPKAKVINKE